MFREFENTAEKETPRVSFFVKLCLPSPKKYKIILERTALSFTTKEYFSLLVSVTTTSHGNRSYVNDLLNAVESQK